MVVVNALVLDETHSVLRFNHACFVVFLFFGFVFNGNNLSAYTLFNCWRKHTQQGAPTLEPQHPLECACVLSNKTRMHVTSHA
eukprot:m.112383 g.112383  ORF g.112383 m.112383 type:complete len:83 (-) comp15325_c2_seq1:66-314(-)